jgi:hypothetical protein
MQSALRICAMKRLMHCSKEADYSIIRTCRLEDRTAPKNDRAILRSNVECTPLNLRNYDLRIGRRNVHGAVGCNI